MKPALKSHNLHMPLSRYRTRARYTGDMGVSGSQGTKENPSLIVGFDLNDTLIKKSGAQHYEAVPGARETMLALRQNNTPFFIASNNEPDSSGLDSVQRFRKVFGDEFKDVLIFTAGNDSERKPSPAMLLNGYAHFAKDRPNAQRVFVGDRATDMEAAKAANAMAIWFKEAQPTEAKPAHASYTVVGHTALIALLQSMIDPEKYTNRPATRCWAFLPQGLCNLGRSSRTRPPG